MLKSPLFWKMTTLFGAVLLLLIPIMLIRQVIVERADYRSDVEDAIRQSTSGPQKLVRSTTITSSPTPFSMETDPGILVWTRTISRWRSGAREAAADV